jgi:hypothetical protein
LVAYVTKVDVALHGDKGLLTSLFMHSSSLVLRPLDFLFAHFCVDDNETNTFFPIAIVMEGFGLMGWSAWKFTTLSTIAHTNATNEICENIIT